MQGLRRFALLGALLSTSLTLASCACDGPRSGMTEQTTPKRYNLNEKGPVNLYGRTLTLEEIPSGPGAPPVYSEDTSGSPTGVRSENEEGRSP